MRNLIEDMRAEWGELDRRILVFEEEFTAHAREDEAARRLLTIPGIRILKTWSPKRRPCRRQLYEDQNVRIAILARGLLPGRIR